MFTLTPGGATLTDTTNSNGSFSVDATGLQPNTDYTAQVIFRDAAGHPGHRHRELRVPPRPQGHVGLGHQRHCRWQRDLHHHGEQHRRVAARYVAIGDEVPGSLNVTSATWSVAGTNGACAAAAPPPTTSVSCMVGTLAANDASPAAPTRRS